MGSYSSFRLKWWPFRFAAHPTRFDVECASDLTGLAAAASEAAVVAASEVAVAAERTAARVSSVLNEGIAVSFDYYYN